MHLFTALNLSLLISIRADKDSCLAEGKAWNEIIIHVTVQLVVPGSHRELNQQCAE